MGRKRIRDKKLPTRVYLKSGTYYYVAPPNNKWLPLGKTIPEMHRALANLHESAGSTVSELIDRYMREILPSKSPNTRRAREWQLEKIRAAFGAMAPDHIQSKHVAAYLDKRSAKVAGNREISALSAVLTKAIRWGMFNGPNPCLGVEKNPEQPRDRYITDDEFWAVWKHARQDVRLFMELSYITGQRLSDVLAMRWSDVTEDGLLVTQGKTGRALVIRVSDALNDVLSRCRQRTIASVFILADTNGQQIPHFTMGSAFRRAVERTMKAGALSEKFTLHDIRAKAGSDSPGELLGHIDPRTLNRVYKRKPVAVEPVR